MTNRRILLICLIVVIPIVVASIALCLGARCGDGGALRVVDHQEARPMLRRLTGKVLPDGVEILRAIVFANRGIEELYIAFRVDPDGYSYILRDFGRDQILRYDFPMETSESIPFVIVMDFDRGHQFQEELGVSIFDKELYGRVKDDYVQYVAAGRYPDDAISGHYLSFQTECERELMYCRVLMFDNLGMVYIAAGRRPEGVYFR